LPNEEPVRRIPAAERREQLLDTARTIILKDGAGALTMSALADAVGVTKPIVYKHFGNSEEVVVEILRRYSQASIDYTSVRVSGARTIFDFMDKMIDALFDFIKNEGSLVRSITNGFSSSVKVDAYFLEMQRRSLRVYKHLLTQQGVPEKQASLAAYALIEMINSTITEFADQVDETDRQTLKQIVRGALRVLVRGKNVKPVVPIRIIAPDQ